MLGDERRSIQLSPQSKYADCNRAVVTSTKREYEYALLCNPRKSMGKYTALHGQRRPTINTREIAHGNQA